MMNYKDKIGTTAYYIDGGKIIKDTIVEGVERTVLNTGSDRHGRLLDPSVSYRFRNDKGQHIRRSSDIFFSKDELIKSL